MKQPKRSVIAKAIEEFDKSGSQSRSARRLAKLLLNGEISMSQAVARRRVISKKHTTKWLRRETINPSFALSDEYRRYIDSKQWKQKRKEAFAFHGRRCKSCRSVDYLEVHHLTYKRFTCENVETDLMVLCRSCHNNKHAARRRN